MTIADRIKDARKEKNLTQEQLAKCVAIQTSQISAELKMLAMVLQQNRSGGSQNNLVFLLNILWDMKRKTSMLIIFTAIQL